MSTKHHRIRKWLEQGLQSHRMGDLEAAERAYLKAAEADPHNADALNLRGAIALTTQRIALAVSLFRKAATLQSGNPGIWSNLGNALFEAGDYVASEEAYRRAERLSPAHPDFAIGIGNALAAAGKTGEAEKIFTSVVSRHPSRAPAWFGLAKLAQSEGHDDVAYDYYQRAVQADPNFGNAHLNLGTVLQSRERMEEAEQSYRRALACGAPREAAYINLISVLSSQGKLDTVEQVARAALAELPRCADIHRLVSAVLAQQGRLQDALASARQAVSLDPDNVKSQLALGGLLFETGFPEQGLAALEKLRLDHPDDRHVAYIVGVTQLAAGQFQAGWRDFKHREARQTAGQTWPRLTDQLPQAPRGTALRVIREQGLGDELFFLRFVPPLKQLGVGVTCLTHPKLQSMLSRSESIDRVIVSSAEEPVDMSGNAVDMLAGDLPHALHRFSAADADIVPPPLALRALPERLKQMQEQLACLGPPPYLALTWRGGTAPHEQQGSAWTLFKHIPLEAFGKTLGGLPFTLLAIQRNPLAEEISRLSAAANTAVHDLCGVNDDLEDMLALLALTDEYAGVSNTNMHLRAGLNRGARVLVPRPSEWRWMAYGERSPWFPGFDVYRQALDGTWSVALERLRTHLRQTACVARTQ